MGIGRRLAGEMESFARDVGFCLTANRSLGPAVVWPAGEPGISEELCARTGSPSDQPPADFLQPVAANGAVAELTDRLGALLGTQVRAWTWDLSPGRATPPQTAGQEGLLMPLTCGFDCRLDASAGTGTQPPAAVGMVLRLRRGSVLYVPAHVSYTLSKGHSRAIALALSLS
jgi:hypothetical protein